MQVDEPKLTVRTNTGYYDQPYYAVERDPPTQQVTVAQLEQKLEAWRAEPDTEMARQLSDLELTERLREEKAAAWEERLHGKKARQALAALADASAFLAPPAGEIPADGPPEPAAQQQMESLAEAYVANTMAKLPDLLALQTIVRYQETPQYHEANMKSEYEPLHVTGSVKTSMRYSHGVEVADTKERPPAKGSHPAPQLETYGTFGPMLAGMLDAITRYGGLTWSRWEDSGGGRAAVFRYAVPQEKSRYEIWVCCLPDGDGTQAFRQFVGYHGEISIDPASGTVLRLEYEADLRSTTPLASSKIVIDYAPVEIGGKKYICPVHSVSILRARSVQVLAEWDESFAIYGPYATMLNDIRFTNYHVFRSESRILPEYSP